MRQIVETLAPIADVFSNNVGDRKQLNKMFLFLGRVMYNVGTGANNASGLFFDLIFTS